MADPTAITRRRAMRLGTAGAAAGAGVAGVGPVNLVDDAEAIACGGLCAGAIAVAAGAAVGATASAALYELDILGKDAPADGLSTSALKQQLYDTAKTRKSTNASTIVDNKNILSYGFKETLYSEGKIAAVEAIQAGKSESQTLKDAKDAVKKHAVTVEKNFIKSWNESAQEFKTMANAASNAGISGSVIVSYDGGPDSSFSGLQDRSETLSDGSAITVKAIWEGGYRIKPFGDDEYVEISVSQGSVKYMQTADWANIWTKIQNEISNALTGIDTWVSNAYSKAQTADINAAELLAPGDRAKLLSEQEDVPQAIADLQALNIPVDLERQATVEIDLPDGTATYKGSLGSSSDTLEIQSGQTYDPGNLSETVYLTYDVSTGKADWTSYQDGVDGGTITLTSQPYQNTVVRVKTTDGETVDVPASSWTENSGNWEYDASTELETTITSVESVTVLPGTDETEYKTIQIKNPFTVLKFTDSDGNTYGSVEFERDEPHDDTNYISEEEWSKRREKYEDLIEEYQESKASGGGGFLNFGGSGLLSGGIPTVAILGGAGYLAWDTFFND